MSDAIYDDDLSAAATPLDELQADALDFPVLDEVLAPIRKPMRAALRPASRHSGDAFDRAFAALEEALKERDAAVNRAMALPKPTPVTYLKPAVQAAVQPAPRMVMPRMMPTPHSAAATPAFVAPAYARQETAKTTALSETIDVLKISLAPDFTRVDQLIAQMQMRQAAKDVAAALVDQMAVARPQPKSQAATGEPVTELLPFGAATYRLLVM